MNRLPGLRVLAFYDPHFGENPICNLCNYQTYVLYHLRNIYKLDTLIISEEAKSFAEVLFKQIIGHIHEEENVLQYAH